MRTIKFRGMDVNGDWYYGNLAIIPEHIRGFHVEVGSYISNSSGMPFAYQVRPETVGQYTGLNDKNGKEIYEGDIFKNSLDWVAVVEWEKEGRFLGSTIENELKIVYINREPRVEVIGNIHVNPELLEVKV
jgi:uncharacterized phage protein (TIGR01671 family)